MNYHEHIICLESEQNFHGHLPSHSLGFLMSGLPVVIRGAVAMALCGRSNAPGLKPEWLKRASDLRFLGNADSGESQLRFELPSLEQAAPEIYAQQEHFETGRPEPHLTGLDVASRVFFEINAGLSESNTFDPQLLRRISRLRRFFKPGQFTEFRIVGSERETCVTPDTIEKSRSLYSQTPAPQRIRLVGELDGIEASTQRFSLLLDAGERVAGVYPKEIADQLQKLWRSRVLVLGRGIFRASGTFLRIEADSIENGRNAPSLFSKLPMSHRNGNAPNRLRKSQGPRSGMSVLMGRWPGDETEEQIEAALEQIS